MHSTAFINCERVYVSEIFPFALLDWIELKQSKKYRKYFQPNRM